MSTVLIDLGEVPHGGATVPVAADQAPPVPYRALLAILSLLLTVSLGGAVRPRPPEPPAVVPAVLGDVIRVVGDRLFVIGRQQPPGARVVRAYALPTGTLLSRHVVPITGEVLDVRAAGDLSLISVHDERTVGFRTLALRAGVEQPLWERPALLQAVSGPDRLLLVREEVLGYPDTWWRGVDLTSGAVRWTIHQREGYEAAMSSTTGYPRWLYMLTPDRQLQSWDARSGRLTATQDVPERGPGKLSLWPAGDLVLIGARGAGTTGYDAADRLRQRWHSGVNLSWYRNPSACGELICAFLPQRGVMVIDPRTGRERWSSDRWNYVERIGPYLLTGLPGTAFPEHFVLDATTGDVLGEAGLWASGGPGPEPETAYVRRIVFGADRVWFGVLDMRRMRIRVAGAAERVAGDCHFAAGALVCRRLDASVGVWRVQ